MADTAGCARNCRLLLIDPTRSDEGRIHNRKQPEHKNRSPKTPAFFMPVDNC